MDDAQNVAIHFSFVLASGVQSALTLCNSNRHEHTVRISDAVLCGSPIRIRTGGECAWKYFAT